MYRAGILCLFGLLPLCGQDIKLPATFDKLAEKASDHVEVNLDGNLLQFAGKFLSSSDPDEARAKALIVGLKSILVRNFEFDKTGQYTDADLEPLRSQLRAPGWSKIIGFVSKRDGDNAEIYTKGDGDKISGLVILAAEPKELTIVQIIGTISLDQLSDLGGQFGIPKVKIDKDKKSKKD